MKNSATKIMKRTGKFSALIMFGAFLLNLTGCQKEELTTTPANRFTTTNQERTFPGVRYDPLPMIFIDHHAFRSVQPDYSVAIFANGDVTFSGHNFTYVIGKINFHVSMGIIQELRSIYDNSGLFGKEGNNQAHNDVAIVDGNKIIKPLKPYIIISDCPFVLTTFKSIPSNVGVTLRDDNRYPFALIALREKTKEVLDIQQFIVGK